jgi:hypothetical protein
MHTSDTCTPPTDGASRDFEIHPVTLEFRSKDVDAAFRRAQMLSHMSFHIVVAGGATLLITLCAAMAYLTDISDGTRASTVGFMLSYMPFVLTKFPLIWWLARNDGTNIRHADSVLSLNLLCMVLSYAGFILRTPSNGGWIFFWSEDAVREPIADFAVFIMGCGFALQVMQSHFYSTFRLRLLLWSALFTVNFLAAPWSRMPKAVEFIATSTICMIAALLSHCLATSAVSNTRPS